jgi:hypothetical protein
LFVNGLDLVGNGRSLSLLFSYAIVCETLYISPNVYGWMILMIDRSRVVKFMVGIVVVCSLATAVLLLVMRLFIGTTLNEPTTVAVQIEAPEQISLNDPFAVTIQLTNLITASQILHSIDVESSYLELSGSTPTYKAVRHIPLTNFSSYRFEEELLAEETVAIELIFVGQTVGQFSGLIDICFADGTLCLARPLETIVVE